MPRLVAATVATQEVTVTPPPSALDGGNEGRTATSMVVVGIIIILLSAVFEKLQHHALHSASKDTKAVLHSLFQELTIMGFISLFLFVAQSLSFMEQVSVALYGPGQESQLEEVFHTAHYVVFLVMFIFLMVAIAMIRVSGRQERWWRQAEQIVRSRVLAGTVDGGRSRRYSQAHPRNWLQALWYRWTDFDGELAVYDALRERFVNADGTMHSSEAMVVAQQTPSTNLDHSNASLYRKKTTVYAFATRDPVRFEKHWGVSEGHRGDMIIANPDGDLYVCPQTQFARSYEPVEGAPHQFRKITTLFARSMDTDFSVVTQQGAVLHGVAGSYLVQDSRSNEQYTITKVEFEQHYELVDAHHAHANPNALPKDFDFASYLAIAQGHLLRKIVEVSLPTWSVAAAFLLLERLVMVIWAGVYGATSYAAIAFSLLAAAATVLVKRKLLAIRRSLVPVQLPAAAKATSSHSGPGAQLHMPLLTHVVSEVPHADAPALGSPPYLDAAPARSSWLSRRVTGRESTPHEKLFWGDALGATLLMEFVRAALLMNSLYVAASIPLNVVPACRSFGGECVAVLAGATIPPLISVSIIPSIISLLSIVSHVEMMKKKKIMGDVLRRQRTARSMRALRLVSALRAAASKNQIPVTAASHHDSANPADASAPPRLTAAMSVAPSLVIQGAAARVYGNPASSTYRKRERELQHVFRLFDRDNTGTITPANLVSLLTLLGLGDTAAETADRIIHELDVSRTRAVGFQEFFDWMALHDQQDAAPHDVTSALFDLIDRDGSGDITAGELRDCLLSLGEAMTQEDVLAIVSEADVNGSGTIDRHEFQDLMERYLTDHN